MNSLLHTPEGVRDIYAEDCAKKRFIEKNIKKTIYSHGYQDVEMPGFEFFDLFNKERGSVPSKEMFKFFDREGNTLVLRPDMTPQIARVAAKYYENEEAPLRFIYQGRKYVNGSSYQGRMKETTQIGAELVGDATMDADAEVIVLLVKSILSTGLKDFQVEIGHIDFFRGLVEEAGLDESEADQMLEMIQEKNFFGVEELLHANSLTGNVAEAFRILPQLFGSIEILDRADELTSNSRAEGAINHLRQLYEILTQYGVEQYITFDLGMLSKLRYYTGVMMQAFTYGSGDYIASGGRYDELIGQFGTKKASIGFSVTVDNILTAITRQKIAIDAYPREQILILYNKECRAKAIAKADELRSDTVNVIMQLKSDLYQDCFVSDYCEKNHISQVIRIEE
ncbi:MAG: ATP phosphoribosyltransferase regulatory subunit [Lachnospiraceae bacterium]|nr:ATP phosphoribosyltransferase regulatory subunit [Lachnospiraceae bacterium]